MNEIFSHDSDMTVVITSCGRFELLQETLCSFIKYNTYPVREIIITEDSGDDNVNNYIPEILKEKTTVIINNPKLGQIKSIDLAYSRVATPYVFHCEDDWKFYRPEFIEDSLTIMETDPKILQVWLRSFHHDLAVHSPYHFLGERQVINSVPCYRVGSHKEDWQGFSFNPGVRRLKDYKFAGGYSSFSSEKKISKYYFEHGYYAIILERDALLHTGFGTHISDTKEIYKKKKKKYKKIIYNMLWTLLIVTFGYVIGAAQ